MNRRAEPRGRAWLAVTLALAACAAPRASGPAGPLAPPASSPAPTAPAGARSSAPAEAGAPPARAECVSVARRGLPPADTGELVPSFTLEPGDQLCVELEHDGECITSARAVARTAELERTLVLRFADGRLELTNPFRGLVLRYSLEPRPASGPVCPALPEQTHAEVLPSGASVVTVSALHFKGEGTAGSELCM
ncbi:MAG: hypothetical protein OZ921_16920 [Sorangiineae bacterium]|nr:hypothetical protein [Polyangiaceae bacterium]MEB2324198.1 hypothetical protein [Sorangiineae bacterium]